MDIIGTIFTPKTMMISWVVLKLILVVMICVICSMLIFTWKRFNIKVIILEKVGKGWQFKTDKGRAFEKNKQQIFKLFWRNKKIEPIQSKYFFSLGKKRGVILTLVNGLYVPVEIDEEKLSTKYPKHIMDKWAAMEFKASFEKYKKLNWFEKYGPMVMTGITVIICFVMFLIVSQKIGLLAEAIHHMATAVDSGQTLKGAAGGVLP